MKTNRESSLKQEKKKSNLQKETEGSFFRKRRIYFIHRFRELAPKCYKIKLHTAACFPTQGS